MIQKAPGQVMQQQFYRDSRGECYLHANNNKSANTQLSSYLAHVYGKKKKI